MYSRAFKCGNSRTACVGVKSQKITIIDLVLVCYSLGPVLEDRLEKFIVSLFQSIFHKFSDILQYSGGTQMTLSHPGS
jgi:hypothetical protein